MHGPTEASNMQSIQRVLDEGHHLLKAPLGKEISHDLLTFFEVPFMQIISLQINRIGPLSISTYYFLKKLEGKGEKLKQEAEIL